MKYLHTMIRVKDLDKTIEFFKIIGLKEIRRKENEKGQFTLVFLATDIGEPEIELTYNWDNEKEYTTGRNFGHLAYETENIYELCDKLIKENITINRPPKDGRMMFIKTPDNISIEFLQKGEPLETKEPYKSMENIGSW